MAGDIRFYAGFATLEGGVNGGIAPSLIPKNQCVSATNVTFRQGFPGTRDPLFQWTLEVPQTLTTWLGTFQGAGRYDAGGTGQSGWIVARGGRLFFIADTTWALTEITPKVTVVTGAQFAVPANGASIVIPVNDGTPLSTGELIKINGEPFTITNISGDQVTATYTGNSYTSLTANFTMPAVGNQITIQVTNSSWAVPGQTIFIATAGFFKVVSVPDPTHIFITNIGGSANAAPTTLINQPQNVALTLLSGAGVTDTSGNQIFDFDLVPATFDFVYIFQAENYGIILRGQHRTAIFDGASTRLANRDEIPPGYLGAYGWGRIWITRPDRRTFVAGNLVFDTSGGGTAQNNFRDSILKFTDNDFLNEGGAFGVPYNAGDITGMQFLASQDTSLGVGVLLVTTTNLVFSVNAPVDRTTWKNLTYPIQTISLIDYGPESPRGTISVNGDMWYRSPDGFRSFIVARRLFGQPGNVPESREISPVIDLDTPNLLFYGSGVYFDNKIFYTVSPFRTANGSVAHRGLAVMNFDLESSLRNRSSPAWEGITTGLNVLQVGKGRIDNKERMFIFALGNDGASIELWEQTTDNFIDDQTVSPSIITRQPIACELVTRSENFDQASLLNLYTAEIFLDDIAGEIDMTVSFRPDQYPQWVTWQNFGVCAGVQQCSFLGSLPCTIFVPAQRLYASRILLPQPPDSCNQLTTPAQPLRLGYEFQFKIQWTGHCRIKKFRIHAKPASTPMEGSCPPQVVCKEFQMCDENFFTYNAHSS